MMYFSRFGLVWLIPLLLVLFGCHSSSTSSGSAPVTDLEGCANAIPVRFQNGVFTHAGTLSSLADAGYFSVNVAKAGDWLLLETLNEQLSTVTFDPVVSILSANGVRRLATVDTMPVWYSEDPFFYYHFSSAQSVCIKVESYGRWSDSLPGGIVEKMQLNYLLQLSLNPEDQGVYESSPGVGNDDALDGGAAFTLIPGVDAPDVGYSWIHGVLDSAADADVFSFTSQNVAALTDIYVNMESGAGDPSSGLTGMGTTAAVTLELLNSDETVLAQLSPDALRPSLTAVLEADTTYYLRVLGAPGWTPGVNDFYSLLLFSETTATYPIEAPTPNDTIATSQTVEMASDGGGYYSGFFMGHLESEGDVDFYRVSLTQGQLLMLQCQCASAGSGIESFTVGALEADGNVVQEDVEAETPIEWSDSPTSTGVPLIGETEEDVLLRISGTHLPSPTSRFYYCYVLLGDNME